MTLRTTTLDGADWRLIIDALANREEDLLAYAGDPAIDTEDRARAARDASQAHSLRKRIAADQAIERARNTAAVAAWRAGR